VDTGSRASTVDVGQTIYNQQVVYTRYKRSEEVKGYEHIVMAWSPDSAHFIIAGALLGGNLLVLNVTSEEQPVAYAGLERGTAVLA